MASSGADKRKSPRVGAPKVVVRIPSADRFRSHYLKDLSEGGLFIRASSQLPVGAELNIELWPPGEPAPLELPAKIIRAVTSGASGFNGEVGMAVAFTSVSPDVARRLKQVIEAHGEQLKEDDAPAATSDNPLDRVQRIVADLSRAQEQVADLQSQVAELRGEIAAYKDKLHRTEVELTAAQSAMAPVVAKRDQLEVQVKQLKLDVIEAGKQLQVERSSGEVTTLRAKVVELTKQLGDTEAQRQLELQRSSGELTTLRAELTTYRTEVVTLRAKTTELSKQLDEAKARDRELSKLLSGSGSAPDPKPSRRPQAVPLDDEVVIERPPVETPISSESIEFALDQAMGSEESAEGAAPLDLSASPKENFFSGEDVEVSISVGSPAPTTVEAPSTSPGGSKGTQPPSADPFTSFLGDGDKAEESVSVDFDEPEEPPPSKEPKELAGGPAGFVMDGSIGEGKKTYDAFAKDLTRKTRLMPSEGLEKRKPASIDEALLTEMLAASPTYGTVMNQMGSQMKEDRLKQMIYELYARGLLDLRDY